MFVKSNMDQGVSELFSGLARTPLNNAKQFASVGMEARNMPSTY